MNTFAEYKYAILLLVAGVVLFAVPFLIFGMVKYPDSITAVATVQPTAGAAGAAGADTGLGGAPGGLPGAPGGFGGNPGPGAGGVGPSMGGKDEK